MMTRSKTLSKSSAFKSGSKADRILTNLCKVLHPGIAIIASAYLLENYKKSYTYIKVIALVYYSLQLFYLPRKNSLSTEKTNVNNTTVRTTTNQPTKQPTNQPTKPNTEPNTPTVKKQPIEYDGYDGYDGDDGYEESKESDLAKIDKLYEDSCSEYVKDIEDC